MYASDPSTIRAQRARPLLAPRDISDQSMTVIYAGLLDYIRDHGSKESIGETAVNFYLLNHGLALIDQAHPIDARLPEPMLALYNLYHKEVGHIGVRMAQDILFMLTAMTSTTHPDSFQLDFVEDTYGAAARSFIESLAANTSNVSFWIPDFSALKKVFLSAHQASEGLTFGNALGAMRHVLDVRQRELSYGPLWRDIARMFLDFVQGRKSLESTIDTSFTFCHCNGSFFEKGRLFSPVGNELFDALDVQRSGQVPQYVHGKGSLAKAARTQKLHAAFAEHFPEVFKAKLDRSIVKPVTRNQLVFTQKYAHHWNRTMGGGGAGAAAHHPPPPKIFMPVDENTYQQLKKPGR